MLVRRGQEGNVQLRLVKKLNMEFFFLIKKKTKESRNIWLQYFRLFLHGENSSY